MKEVQLGRYAGPFDKPPFEHFIQSPIGLVPKDQGKKTRLIFHLSYPKNGDSINSGIPKEVTSVKYPDLKKQLNFAFWLELDCSTAKSDMSAAFRNVPLAPESWQFLVMKAEHPVTRKIYYFVDKCLPFGSSINCAIFQNFSDAVVHIVEFKSRQPNVNYLDDFFFAHLIKQLCDQQVQCFLDVCSEIQFPVALEKTFWSNTVIVFLGILIDTINQVICIPKEKVERALNMVMFFLNKVNRKVTVLQVQKLCGFLNFLCRCVVPGRAFLTHLYSMAPSKLKPHHHIRISQENRVDLEVWQIFLSNLAIYCRPFMDFQPHTAEEIDMYSDASRHFEKGFGAYCGSHWWFWPMGFGIYE